MLDDGTYKFNLHGLAVQVKYRRLRSVKGAFDEVGEYATKVWDHSGFRVITNTLIASPAQNLDELVDYVGDFIIILLTHRENYVKTRKPKKKSNNRSIVRR